MFGLTTMTTRVTSSSSAESRRSCPISVLGEVLRGDMRPTAQSANRVAVSQTRTTLEASGDRDEPRASSDRWREPLMYETPEDLVALQALLAVSYNRAGEHLRTIWGPETRLPAQQVSSELAGVQILDLATVTPKA